MGFNTIFTLAVVAVIVAALALYLIDISSTLNKVSFTVGTVLIGVRSIAAQCEPIGPVMRNIVSDIQAIDEDLEALVASSDTNGSQGVGGGLPFGTRMYGPPTKGW